MSLFRLDASIRTEGSHSRQIADIVQQEWRNAHPADAVINREIGIDPLPSNAWATAVFARYSRMRIARPNSAKPSPSPRH